MRQQHRVKYSARAFLKLKPLLLPFGPPSAMGDCALVSLPFAHLDTLLTTWNRSIYCRAWFITGSQYTNDVLCCSCNEDLKGTKRNGGCFNTLSSKHSSQLVVSCSMPCNNQQNDLQTKEQKLFEDIMKTPLIIDRVHSICCLFSLTYFLNVQLIGTFWRATCS